MLTVEQIRSKAASMRSMGAATIEAYQLDELADEIERLRSAARDVVLAYKEANPMRTADMHPAKCGCLRCEIDRLDHVSGESE